MRKLILFGILFFGFYSGTFARTVTTSTIDGHTIRFHITATSWADLISPQGDCGTAPPNGDWALTFFNVGNSQEYQSTNTIYPKGTLDITEDFTLADGTYHNGIIFGSNATDWTNLHDVTSCGTIGGSPYGSGFTELGTTTIPLPTIPAPTSSCYSNCIMSTTTDAIIGHTFGLLYMFIILLIVVTVAWFCYKIIK